MAAPAASVASTTTSDLDEPLGPVSIVVALKDDKLWFCHKPVDCNKKDECVACITESVLSVCQARLAKIAPTQVVSKEQPSAKEASSPLAIAALKWSFVLMSKPTAGYVLLYNTDKGIAAVQPEDVTLTRLFEWLKVNDWACSWLTAPAKKK